MAMKRWTRRALWAGITLAVLLVAALVAIQIIFLTDLPRRLVVNALQDATGLRVSADSLDTGWLGYTALTNVRLALPLEDQPFAVVPALQLSHTSFFKLILLRTVEVESVALEEPEIWLVQDEAGQWNIQQVMAIYRAKNPPQEAPPKPGDIQFPEVTVTDATLHVLTPDQPEVVIRHIGFDGAPETDLTWAYHLNASPVLEAQGRLVTGATWQHTAELTASELDRLVTAFAPEAPVPIQVRGRWEGQIVDGRLEAQAQFEQLRAGPTSLAGALRVRAGEATTLRPAGLTIQHESLPWPVRVESGMLQLAQDTLSVDRLLATFPYGQAQTSGRFNLNDRTGNLQLRWNVGLPEQTIAADGRLSVVAEVPEVGRRSVEATLVTHGSVGTNTLAGEAKLSATGASYEALDIDLAIPRLVWRSEDEGTSLGPIQVEMVTRGMSLQLRSLSLPNTRTSRARGEVNLETKAWHLQMSAEQWLLPGAGDRPLDIRLQGEGVAGEVNDASLELEALGLTATAEGSYQPDRDVPLAVRLNATYPMTIEAAEAEAPPNFHAVWQADFELAGTVKPLDLQLGGVIDAQDAAVKGQPLEELSIPITSQIQEDWIALQTSQPFPFLGGEVSFGGTYPMEGRGVQDVELDFEVERLPIRSLTTVLEWPWDAHGYFSTQVRAAIPWDRPSDLQVQGDWALYDLRGHGLETDTAHGTIQMSQGVVRLEDILFEREDGKLTGGVTFNIHESRILKVRVAAERWPWVFYEPVEAQASSPPEGPPEVVPEVALEITPEGLPEDAPQGSPAQLAQASPEGEAAVAAREPVSATPATGPETLSLIIDADAELDVNLGIAPIQAQGDFDFAADLAYRQVDVGRVDLEGTVEGRTLELRRVGGRLLDGQLSGAARVPLDRPLTSRGRVTAMGVNFETLPEVAPVLAGSGGLADVQMTVAESDDPHALAPVKVTLDIKGHDARINQLAFDEASFIGYYRDESSFFLEDSKILLAGGSATLWGNYSLHDDERYTHLWLNFDRVSIDEILKGFELEQQTVVGRLSGHVSLVSYFEEDRRMWGHGNLQVTDSDLANVDFIGALANALVVGDQESKGYGEAHLTLEGSRLTISRLTYFNRPLYVNGQLSVTDVAKGLDSPIGGLFIGSLRQLKDVDLGLFEQLDTALEALQQGVAAARVQGTLGERDVDLVPVPRISGALERLMGGDAE